MLEDLLLILHNIIRAQLKFIQREDWKSLYNMHQLLHITDKIRHIGEQGNSHFYHTLYYVHFICNFI